MELKDRLKELRKEKGYSQAKLAEKANIARNTYIKWENGTRNPREDKIEKLAQIFDVSIDYIKGKTNKKNETIEPETVNLGIRLQNLRKEKELNKKELANQINVPYPTYIKWENNATKPDLETLGKLSKFYNTSIDYLLGKTDYRNSQEIPENELEKILDQETLSFDGKEIPQKDREIIKRILRDYYDGNLKDEYN